MPDHFEIAKGQLSPSYQDVITIDGVAQDITAATVRFRMRAVGSSTLKVDAEAVKVTPASGIARYDWAGTDTDTTGSYLGWWQVTWGNGLPQDSIEFPIEVVEHAALSRSLCTLAEVRAYIGKPVEDRRQDPVLLDLIGAASRAIEQYARRQFTLDTSSSARIFIASEAAREDHYRIDDLSAAPTAFAVLDADGDSVGTLDVATELEYLPLRRRSDEPIEGFRLRPRASLALAGSYRLSITGTWGWPSIPEQIRLAAVQQVREWWRSDMVVGTNTFSDQPQTAPATPRSLSVGTKRLVDPFRTPVVG